MGRKGKLKNNIVPKPGVRNDKLADRAYTENPAVIDFSYKYVLCSVYSKKYEFTNFFESMDSFVKKILDLHKLTVFLGQNSLSELINGKEHPHCHKLDQTANDKFLKIINEVMSNNNVAADEYVQQLEGENIYQLGENGPIRLFGVVLANSNIFRVYLVDYYHLLYQSQKYNEKDLSHYQYKVE